MIKETEQKGLEWIVSAFEAQLKSVNMLRAIPVKKRKENLAKLKEWIHSNRKLIHHAMFDDFRKPSTEVDSAEIFHVLNEINYALDNINSWTKPTKVDAPITMLGTRSHIQFEPRGVCLIISPWNYPFSLCAGPLVSALAAGNRVIIKPSELTPNVSALLKKMSDAIFQHDEVMVCEGGVEVSQHLLTLPFDHIFFTGSPSIGKIVMKAAAENLTSITLELGGKSPTIVSASANFKDAAQRIAVGKFLNVGQTCVAPDYLLVDEKISHSFTKELIIQTKNLFIENNESFDESNNYGRVVNEKHFDRLNDLLQEALNLGAKLELTGNVDRTTKFFHPMILSNVLLHSRLLDEEIFGPILPIVTYKNIDDAIEIINSKPKALALYLFTSENKVQEKILSQTSSGAVCINECAIHFLHHNLPFGGINNSGIGKSHGYFGFQAFSNEKSVLKQRNGFTTVKPFYPPYTSFKKKLMELFLKLF